jgi:hypothetical protein
MTGSAPGLSTRKLHKRLHTHRRCQAAHSSEPLTKRTFCRSSVSCTSFPYGPSCVCGMDVLLAREHANRLGEPGRLIERNQRVAVRHLDEARVREQARPRRFATLRMSPPG